ncbi:PaaI family thioesterase [uncultured Shimia sp.]|uniref:PaaI family thioesterase n=1 Tax=uncultured Shimia sp. TaxID=573152 RepID=UPI002611F629|nr:PaaI family thioesterase [uncultured Shimia sp.]
MTAPIRKPLPLAKLIGFAVEVDGAAREAHCVLKMQDVHRNRHGVLHGGIISTLLDTASGVTASLTVDDLGLTPFTTVSLNINFMAPATSGTLRATGRVTGGGRSMSFVEAELVDENGTRIATSTGVFKRVRTQQEGMS